MEERSETVREAARRDDSVEDTTTPGMDRAPEPHADERDPAHAGSPDLRRKDTLKGGSTGG